VRPLLEKGRYPDRKKGQMIAQAFRKIAEEFES